MAENRTDFPRYRADGRSPVVAVHGGQSRRDARVLIAALAVLAGALVLALTVNGMRLSPDSYEYMSTAADITTVGGIPVTYSWWPPLQPLILAPFEDMQAAARWLNALCLAGTVALTLTALRRHSVWILIGVGAALMLSPALQFVHQWVWSEPLFVLHVAAWFALLASEVETQRRIALLGLVAALLGLQRYVGILFVPLGLFALLLARARWQPLMLYAFTASVPPGIWLLRNILLGYPASGLDRGAAYFSFFKATEAAILTGISWVPMLALVFVLGALTSVRFSRSLLVVCAYYVIGHTVFIIWSASSTSMDGPDQRLLAPVVVPLVYGMLALGGQMALLRQRKGLNGDHAKDEVVSV